MASNAGISGLFSRTTPATEGVTMALLDYVTGLCTEIRQAASTFVTKLSDGSSSPEGATVHPFHVPSRKRGDRPRDDVRRANETLCNEFTQVQEEFKRLRAVVDQLSRDYESSKEYDFFRRYGLLKRMIKRTVVALKLTNDDAQKTLSASCIKQKDELIRKREQQLTGMSIKEVSQENNDMHEQIKEFRRKLSMIRDLIEQMERQYESAKRFIVVQRYRLMKIMVKTIIHNKWIV